MTKTELRTKLLTMSHRNDLADVVDFFIGDAEELIETRFNVTITDENGTNSWLQQFPLLYSYGALASLYEYIKQGDDARFYKERWDEVASLAFLQFTDEQSVEVQ